eukprot:249783_1
MATFVPRKQQILSKMDAHKRYLSQNGTKTCKNSCDQMRYELHGFLAVYIGILYVVLSMNAWQIRWLLTNGIKSSILTIKINGNRQPSAQKHKIEQNDAINRESLRQNRCKPKQNMYKTLRNARIIDEFCSKHVQIKDENNKSFR